MSGINTETKAEKNIEKKRRKNVVCFFVVNKIDKPPARTFDVWTRVCATTPGRGCSFWSAWWECQSRKFQGCKKVWFFIYLFFCLISGKTISGIFSFLLFLKESWKSVSLSPDGTGQHPPRMFIFCLIRPQNICPKVLGIIKMFQWISVTFCL